MGDGCVIKPFQSGKPKLMKEVDGSANTWNRWTEWAVTSGLVGPPKEFEKKFEVAKNLKSRGERFPLHSFVGPPKIPKT